jgi:DNA-binding response OmpR family regulator
MHVLLVENNNLDQSESLFSGLEEQGHNVFLVHTSETASHKTATVWPNLVVFHQSHGQLDLAGFQDAISQTKLNIPHIVVGKRKHLPDNIDKDTILVAPSKPHQLNQSILKATVRQKRRFLRLPGLIIDCEQYNLLHNGRSHSLTPKEFKLLYLLISNPDQVLSRKTIMQKVWETDYMGDTRTLDVHIRWLREKIEEKPSQPQRLITTRGVGYRFVSELESK